MKIRITRSKQNGATTTSKRKRHIAYCGTVSSHFKTQLTDDINENRVLILEY